MRNARRLSLLFSIALLGLSALHGCRSSNAYAVDEQQTDRVLLVVKNDNFLDMDVYALSGGLPSRVGTVTGLSTARFALNPTLYSASDLRIIATPIGGNGRASSGPLAVRSGQTIDFTIGSRLPLSFATVR